MYISLQTDKTIPTLLRVKQANRLEVNNLINRVVITADQHNSRHTDSAAPRGEIRKTLGVGARADTVVHLTVHSSVYLL